MGWLFAAQALRAILQATYFLLLARGLGSSGLGQIAATLAVTALLLPFASLGSGSVMIMQTARQPSVVRTSWGNTILTTSVGGLFLIIVVTLALPLLIPQLDVRVVLLLAIAELYFVRISESAAQAFQGLEKMAASAATTVISSSFRVAFTGIFFFSGFSRTTTLWSMCYLLAAIASAVVAFAMVVRAVGAPRFDLLEARARLAEGLQFAIGSSATTAYTDIDKLMMARLATLNATGIYAAAYRIIGLSFMPVSALLLAAYPRFFRHGAGGICKTWSYSLRLLKASVVYCLLIGVLLFLAAPFAPRLLGSDFRGAVEILRWLALLPLLQAVYYMGADVLTGAGLQARRTRIQLCAAAANILMNMWLIPAHGAMGAAWSTLATYAALASGVWISAALARRGERKAMVASANPGLAG